QQSFIKFQRVFFSFLFEQFLTLLTNSVGQDCTDQSYCQVHKKQQHIFRTINFIMENGFDKKDIQNNGTQDCCDNHGNHVIQNCENRNSQKQKQGYNPVIHDAAKQVANAG